MSKVHIDIHPLNADGYDAIFEVWTASGLRISPTGRESRESFEMQMVGGHQTCFGAVIDGKLVGVVLATHDGRKGWINRLAVLPDYRRYGVAAKLVETAERSLYGIGLTVVAALVEHENEASLELFKKQGYRVHNVYYVSKRENPDA
jgi:ribosomal protein S18 acetylase RimI-like enzyme